ncbi:MAG: hypothetical protein ABI417_05630 [Coleofasciculaceae cyanobacterium]
MKVTIVQANKFKLSFAVVLLFSLAGCVDGLGQVGVMTKCRQAEVAVDVAQKEYEQSILNLAKKPTDQQTKNAVTTKTKDLGETEENAFKMCNRIK